MFLFSLRLSLEQRTLHAANEDDSADSTGAMSADSVATAVSDSAGEGQHTVYLSIVEHNRTTPILAPTVVNQVVATPTVATPTVATPTVATPTVAIPTWTPTSRPSNRPTVMLVPSVTATAVPTDLPTGVPTALPTAIPPATILPTNVAVPTVAFTVTLTGTGDFVTPMVPTGTANPTIPNATVPNATVPNATVPNATVVPVTTSVVSATEVPTSVTVMPTIVPTVIQTTVTPVMVTPTLVTFTPTPNTFTPSPTMRGTVGTILLPATATPTVIPAATIAPTVTATQTESATSPCSTSDLLGSSSNEIMALVEDDADCAGPLVQLLIDDPATYFDAFYALVPSVDATEALWWAVYNAMSSGDFLFDADAVESLWENLPTAAAACTDHLRCQYWASYMVEPLLRGEMYRCPDLTALSDAELIESIPYGNYYCTADSVIALVPLVDEADIDALLTIAAEAEQSWSRRNGLRVLGRIAERGLSDPAGELVLDTMADDVKAMLSTRLLAERSTYALEDLLWIADSHFYPFFEVQAAMESITTDVTFADTVTFRSMAAITRLLAAKNGLLQQDLDFVLEQLSSTFIYVRAHAARTLTVLEPANVGATDTVRGDAERIQIMAALTDRLTVEELFMVQIAMQEALDLYAGTNDVLQLQADYEAEHLAATIEEAPITIRSGLPQAELPAFLARMQATELAYFGILGESFHLPVPDDPTDAMTLLLFETRTAYQEYMDAFVGFGSQAGGLYIERDATLYTYQRTAAESSFTIEHLVQHEFTHYLNGRYVFPELWTDPGFHDQPKGWIDEGTAEYFGLTIFEEDGSYTQPLADSRLNSICAKETHHGIGELINRRSGYDEAGVFDYDYAWAFMYYLFQQRPAVALRVFDEYRAETYDVASFAAIAGIPSIDLLENAWHSTIDGWCGSRNQLQAASRMLDIGHDRHESEIISHLGTIYTLPLPPLQSTGDLDDGDKVIRLITSE